MTRYLRVIIVFSIILFLSGNLTAVQTSAEPAFSTRASSPELTGDQVRNMTVIWDDTSEHTENVWMVRWSPNGTDLVTVGFDDKIALWNGTTSEQRWNLSGAHSDRIRSVGWSPNGKMLATGSEGGTIKIWNASSGLLIKHLNDSALLPDIIAHVGPVVALSWSMDGRTLASVSGMDAELELTDKGDNVVKLWDVIEGYKTVNLTDFDFKGMDVAFSPVQPDVLGAAGDNEGRIINITSEERIRTFKVNNTAHSISWSPNGTLVSIGTHNFTVELFNVDEDNRAGYFLDLEYKRREIAWSPSGRYIAEAGSGDSIKIRAVENGTIMTVLFGTPSRCVGNYIPSISWSSIGNYLAAASAGVYGFTVFGDLELDLIAPKLIDFSPTGTTTPVNAAIMVRFSEPISYSGFITAFKYSDGNLTWTASDGTVEKFGGDAHFGREFLFLPENELDFDTTYVVSLSTDLTDRAGNKLSGINLWTFRTVKNFAPVLSEYYFEPEGGDETATFTFYCHYLDLDGDEPVDFDVVIDGEKYQMEFHNGSKSNGYFKFETRLTSGHHSYYFIASDGLATAMIAGLGPDQTTIIDVATEKENGGILTWQADVIGVIIVLLLILGWFKLVARGSEKKKK